MKEAAYVKKFSFLGATSATLVPKKEGLMYLMNSGGKWDPPGFLSVPIRNGRASARNPRYAMLQKKTRLDFYLRQPAGTLRVGPPAPLDFSLDEK